MKAIYDQQECFEFPVKPVSNDKGKCSLAEMLIRHNRDCRWCELYWAGPYANPEDKCPHNKSVPA